MLDFFNFIFISTLALCLGFMLDLCIGDPQHWPHLVRLIGRLISRLEKLFYPCPNKQLGGLYLVLSLLITMGGLTASLLLGAWIISPWLYLCLETVLCWQCLALTSLKHESGKVYDALASGNLEQSRYAVSRIVGRDTGSLTESQITKATIETIAENASDGVIAPLFFLACGGGLAGVLYKCINTMDSMIGYQNERYWHFGTVAAKLDDAVNYLPARLTALVFICSANLLRLDAKNAWKIWRRDKNKHKSPNAAHPESAVAGALNIELAGDASYFGKIVAKPCIGDNNRPIVLEDILLANRLLMVASLITFAIALTGRILLYATL